MFQALNSYRELSWIGTLYFHLTKKLEIKLQFCKVSIHHKYNDLSRTDVNFYLHIFISTNYPSRQILEVMTQKTLTYLKSAMDTPEQCIKFVQS